MAFTHQKTVTVTPVDDNYSWTKSGDGNGNWVQITQAQGDTWNFAVSDNNGSTRTCVCTVTHSNGVTSDSFTITQAGVGSPPPTTTTTTTEAPATTTTTTEAPTTTTTTTEATADPVYRTTWVAINNVANTFVAGNDSPTTLADDDQWEEATAGTPVTEYFFIHPQDGYSFTGVDNVTIGGVTQGTAVVDTSLTSNGNIKVIVTHTTGSANTTINVTLNGAAVADPAPTTTTTTTPAPTTTTTTTPAPTTTTTTTEAVTFQWDSSSTTGPTGGGSLSLPFTYSGTDPVVADFSENIQWLTIQSVNITQSGQSGELVCMLLQNSTQYGRNGQITHTLPGTSTTATTGVNQNPISNQFNWTTVQGPSTTFEDCGSTLTLEFSWQAASAPTWSNTLFAKPSWVSINASTFTTSTAQGGTSGTGSVEVTANAYTTAQSRSGNIVWQGLSSSGNDTDLTLYQTGDPACGSGPGDPQEIR